MTAWINLTFYIFHFTFTDPNKLLRYFVTSLHRYRRDPTQINDRMILSQEKLTLTNPLFLYSLG